MKVLIREIETDKIEKEIECQNLREAEKTERGVNINLNQEDYYTEIMEEE